MTTTSKESKISFDSPSLLKQVEELLANFVYDGKVLTYQGKFISEKFHDDSIYERYKNEIHGFNFKDQNIEEILPFVNRFNEKRFWQIEYNDKIKLIEGQRLVSQDGQSIIAEAGEYLNGGFFREEDKIENRTPLDPDTSIVRSFVYLYRAKKIDRPKKNLYVNLEGDYAVKVANKPLIRFYFNLLPDLEGIVAWANYLQYTLDRHRIPFQLKYPLNLKNYNYSDSGVLYISQNHYPLVAQVLKEFMENLGGVSIVGKSIPLFTRKLYDGVGFAEDPFSSKDSFGEQRCKLIWKIITTNKLVLGKDSRIDTLETIVAHLKKLKYTDKFYRSPNTDYKYNFDTYFNPSNIDSKTFSYVKQAILTLEKRIDKVNDETKKYDRYQFLEIAENYAKDLIEKAIWNPTTNCYDWITYAETDKKEGFYRVVEEPEKRLLKLFLQELVNVKKKNKDYYTNFLNKICVETDSLVLEEKDYTDLFHKISLDDDLINIIQNIQSEIDKIDNVSDILKGSYKLASNVNNYYEKLKLPMKNSFGNYEYCPNFDGKLKIAWLFLIAYQPMSFKNLLELYNQWYKKQKNHIKLNLQILQSLSSLFFEVDK